MKKSLIGFQPKWEALVDKSSNYDNLSRSEKVWLNIQIIIQHVDSGGLISYYYNSGADYLEETMNSLEIIGAEDVKELLMSVNTLSPNNRPSRNLNDRNAVINGWEEGKYTDFLNKLDKSFFSKEKELEAKLVSYITENNLA